MLKYLILLVFAWKVLPAQSSISLNDLSFMEFLSQHMEESNTTSTNIRNNLNGRTLAGTGNYDWNSFYRLNDTFTWMVSIVLKYPGLVTAHYGGATSEGRRIFGLKISARDGNSGIFIEAGMHGCEWISPAAATYLISQLVDPPNETIRTVSERYDWYIFPHVNPDGYAHSRYGKHTRHWSRNRSKADGSKCIGVDLNRNWDYHWGEDKTEECTETYAGSHGFSEIETRSFSEYLTGLENKIQLYISLHSDGQLILYPYGYTSEPPENINDYNLIMEAAKEGFAQLYKTEYKGGSIYNNFHPFSGSSLDWVYGTGITELAFQIHLRTPIRTENGYQIDEQKILPICEETLYGIISMVNEAKKLKYL